MKSNLDITENIKDRSYDYYRAIAKSAQLLIEVNDLKWALQGITKVLCDSMGALRVRIYENVYNEEGLLCCELKYEATSHNRIGHLRDGTVQKVIPYRQKGFEEIYHTISQGKHHITSPNKIDEAIRNYLCDISTNTVCFVPLFVEHQFWGFITFELLEANYVCDQWNLQLANSISDLIGSFLGNKKKEKELDSLNKTLLASVSLEENIIRLCNKASSIMNAMALVYFKRNGQLIYSNVEIQPEEIETIKRHLSLFLDDTDPVLIRDPQQWIPKSWSKIYTGRLLLLNVHFERKMLSHLLLLLPEEKELLPSERLILNILSKALALEEEQLRTLQVIKEERAKLLTVFDNIDASIYVCSPETFEILFANRTAKELLNREVIGEICYKTIYGFERPCSYCKTINSSDKNMGSSYMREWYDSRRDKWYSVLVRDIVWIDGQRVHYSMLVDQTEKKKLEEAYVHAQKMEAISRLTAGFCHEFNNILSIIMGNLDFILNFEINKDSHTRRFLEDAIIGTQKAAKLIRDLLSYSRKSSEIEKQPLELVPIIKRIVRLFSSGLEKDIVFRYKIDGELWKVVGDESHMEQILSKLCLNAKEAIREKISKIERPLQRVYYVTISAKNCSHVISSTDESLSGDYVRVTVEDEGCGIPPHLLDRIFEPFFSTKPIKEGGGMGLALVYSFVKGFGGWIDVETQEDKGSKFHLYFPRYKE